MPQGKKKNVRTSPFLSPARGPCNPLLWGQDQKSFVLIILLCLNSHFWEGKGRGKHPPLPFPPSSEVSAVEEELKWFRLPREVTDVPQYHWDSSPITSHPSLTQVALRAGATRPPLTHRSQSPQSSLSNSPGPLEPADQEAEHRPLRNANLRVIFRPPQRRVKKLWLLAYMNVAKLSLNQRQRLKMFLQAKSLLFSKSPSKDQKLQLLNLITQSDHYICLHKDQICSGAYI